MNRRRAVAPQTRSTQTPDPQRPTLKDPELYDRLVADGASSEKAARISNAAARDGRETVAHRGGTAQDLDDRSVVELKRRARELGVPKYSRMRRHELLRALREH
jgi:Rho termination factor, N-terminal domain